MLAAQVVKYPTPISYPTPHFVVNPLPLKTELQGAVVGILSCLTSSGDVKGLRYDQSFQYYFL